MLRVLTMGGRQRTSLFMGLEKGSSTQSEESQKSKSKKKGKK